MVAVSYDASDKNEKARELYEITIFVASFLYWHFLVNWLVLKSYYEAFIARNIPVAFDKHL